MLRSVILKTPTEKLVNEYSCENKKLVEDNKVQNQSLLILKPEDKYNLVGFFALLIKVDKRINPHLYSLASGFNINKKEEIKLTSVV